MSRIGNISGGNSITLPDKDGTSKQYIRNNLGFAVWSVDSQGNIRHRGTIGRTARV